jgi:hypothetical protein
VKILSRKWSPYLSTALAILAMSTISMPIIY